MSAIGPKRTSLAAPHMSAFGGKADMRLCGNPLSRSLVRRTRLLLTQSGHSPCVGPRSTCWSFGKEVAFALRAASIYARLL
jgi:hypothetical protein